jgi:hypothetical protein
MDFNVKLDKYSMFKVLKIFPGIRPQKASLAQSVERQTLNLLVVGSSPTGGVTFP